MCVPWYWIKLRLSKTSLWCDAVYNDMLTHSSPNENIRLLPAMVQLCNRMIIPWRCDQTTKGQILEDSVLYPLPKVRSDACCIEMPDVCPPLGEIGMCVMLSDTCL